MTITQAIASKTPVFGLLKNLVTNGDIFVKALVVYAITDLNKFLNFQNIMTTPQIAETAEMILSDYNALKIEDIRVCFGNGKRGHYGQLFGRMDGQIIMLWLAQYSTDRTNEFLRIRDLAEKAERNKVFDKSEINPEGQKKVLEILSQYAKKIEPKIKQPVEKSERDILIQRFFRQFTKIVYKRSIDDSYRFIFMYGKILSSPEYVEIKLTQHKRVKSLPRYFK